MADYISREAALSEVCHGCSIDYPCEPCEPQDCEIKARLEAIPASDVVEVRHGWWIDKTWTTEDDWSCYNHHIVICSVCNKQFDYIINEKSNYCPNCGAKMDGDGE